VAPPGLHRAGWDTVVCCGGGPSFSEEQAAQIIAAQAAGRCRVIVTNNGWQRVPSAEVLYAHDGTWFRVYIDALRAGFPGELWTQDLSAAKKYGLQGIRSLNRAGLTASPKTLHVGGNSGYGAINLAYLFGARRILLVGFDMQRTGGASHWHGDHVKPLSTGQPFSRWLEKFPQLARDLAAAGVATINCSTDTALMCFPRASLEDALAGAPAPQPRTEHRKPPRPMPARPLTSIIIPTYQHADVVCGAISSALAQTSPVEVIVVDDKSTDGTSAAIDAAFGERYLRVFDPRLRVVPCVEHGGVSAARNVGIGIARGDYLMFLDADDTIEPTKVAEQIDAMTDEVGFVLCDTRIVGVDGRAELASKRYDYAGKDVGGWIAPLLDAANFIPVHAPLIRRSALGDLRFEDRALEDWHFWHALAQRARCRYLPRVLATYSKRAGSRNATAKVDRRTAPGVVAPLRLNLGCGTPGALSWHPIPGLVNLDKSMGWRFEDLLPDYADGSVDGITVSHALMYVRDADLPKVFSEFARVLAPGGVLRITEDDTTNPKSRRLGGWRGSESAVIQTDAAKMRRLMEATGFTVHDVAAGTSVYRDLSLCQAQHGAPPDVFFIEGRRESSVLFAPHSDDEVLFAAFSMIRHRPRIVICHPSSGDYGATATRLEESRTAAAILGAGPVEQWDGKDLDAKMRELDRRLRPTIVFAPSIQTSHLEHKAVAMAAEAIFPGDRLRRYHTYRQRVDVPPGSQYVAHSKVRDGVPAPHEPGWVDLKRAALACYASQLAHPRAREFFSMDLAEYLE